MSRLTKIPKTPLTLLNSYEESAHVGCFRIFLFDFAKDISLGIVIVLIIAGCSIDTHAALFFPNQF